MTGRYRRGVTVLFVLCAVLCGFGAGAWLGARYFVPPGSGLVGPFMVLGYGIAGAVVGLGAGLGAAWMLRGRALVVAAVPVIIAGLALAGIMGYSIFKSRSEQEAYLADQRASLPLFDLSLAIEPRAPDDSPFARFDYNGGEHAFEVTAFDGASCRGKLSPTSEEKLTLLVALRHVEELLMREPDPCAGDGPATMRLAFRISEHMPPDTRGDVAMSAQCVGRHEELADAVSSIEAVQESLEETCR